MFPKPKVEAGKTVGPCMKLKHFYPLLGFAAPTVLIAYGIAIPRSCFAGVNLPTIGFAMAILGACLIYCLGIRLALREVMDDTWKRASRIPVQAHHLVPWLAFATLAAIIGYGLVIPRSCIAGINEHSVGFGLTILFAGVVYTQGMRRVFNGEGEEDNESRVDKLIRARHFYAFLEFWVIPDAKEMKNP